MAPRYAQVRLLSEASAYLCLPLSKPHLTLFSDFCLGVWKEGLAVFFWGKQSLEGVESPRGH